MHQSPKADAPASTEGRFTPGPWHIIKGDSVVNVAAGTECLNIEALPGATGLGDIERALAALSRAEGRS